jgi:hypothetical protein
LPPPSVRPDASLLRDSGSCRSHSPHLFPPGLSYRDLRYLRYLAVRQPCLALSCAMRQAILFPPLIKDDIRVTVISVIDEVSSSEAFGPRSGSLTAVAARMLCRFCQTCIEYSSVFQSIGWLAQVRERPNVSYLLARLYTWSRSLNPHAPCEIHFCSMLSGGRRRRRRCRRPGLARNPSSLLAGAP